MPSRVNDVLSKFILTSLRAMQLANMVFIFSMRGISHDDISMLLRDLHPSNILAIFVTFEVLNPSM